jgi:hypothetical protein
MVNHLTIQNRCNICSQCKEVVGIQDHSRQEGHHIANQVSPEEVTVMMEDIQLHKVKVVRITPIRLAVVVLAIHSLLVIHHLLVRARHNLFLVQSAVVLILVI